MALGTVAAVLIAWWVFTATGIIPPERFASPREFWDALRQVELSGYADARLHAHVLHSAKLVLMGFAVAIATGVPLGVAMGWSRRIEALLNPAFLLVRPIPPLAWIPLAIVWLGLGDAAKVLVIWFAAFVPSVINSYAGVRSLERHVVEAARMLGASRWMMLREVIVPGAAPLIFTGLRLSLQACWTTLVAGELIGAAAGLGHLLQQSALDIFPAMILVGMVFVAIAGGAMTWALGRVEVLAMPWRR
jgi:NitT/TauT family transport system permease protein/taurine transport system permease protein